MAIILLFALSAASQSNQVLDLRWKIEQQNKLTYATVMNEIDPSEFDLNWDSFFKSFSENSAKSLEAGQEFFKQFNNLYKDFDYSTTLENKGNGIISVTLNSVPKKTGSNKDSSANADDFRNMAKSFMEGVLIRGSVYENGTIHSFWMKTNQKNLLALLFELPGHPVKEGDSWPLSINLIENDEHFSCDTSFKRNKVTLSEIKKIGNETIAVLKYDVIEYVKGIFNMPAFMGNKAEPKDLEMKFTIQGIAEFSVEKGRWVNYDCFLNFESSGMMDAHAKTKFTLKAN